MKCHNYFLIFLTHFEFLRGTIYADFFKALISISITINQNMIYHS